MRRRTGLLCFALAAGGAIVGCGGAGPTAIMVVTRAATNTRAAKTARVSFSLSINGQTIRNVGIADFAKSQASYTATVPGVGSIDTVQDGTTIFVKLPAKTATLAGKPWIKFDLATGLHKLTGIDAKFFSQSANNDPTSTLDYLRGASRDVHKVGTETLHGAQTTKYRGTVDLRRAAANAANADRRKGLQQTAKVLGVNSFAADVWIDTDSRLRQMRYSLDTSKFHVPTGIPQPHGTAAYTFEFYDFGVSFSLPRLPSPDQVVDINRSLSDGGPLLATTPPSSGVPLSEAIVSAPTGFVATTSHDLPNGPIDQAAFARLLGSKTIADQLHFVAGYNASFGDAGGGADVEVSLLQFGSPTAAAIFDQTVFAGFKSHGMVAAHNVELPASLELNAARTDSSGRYEHLVVARKQNRVVVVDYYDARQGPAPLANTIARQEYGRL